MNHDSALIVNDGVEQPPNVNPYKRDNTRKAKHHYSPEEYVDLILQGNRIALSQAITLVESNLHSDRLEAQTILEKLLPYSGKSIRVGITGVPGAGKSSFIEQLGILLTQQGHKVVVLAVDPSSKRTEGSILGDKTRMEHLSVDPNAFIRPSPSGGSLGGVARKTRETVILCEAAGFDIVLIETVGVGQSETEVHSMVDCFLLLLIAGAGDELQGIKRGIMEMCDILAVTKADGDNILRTQQAKRQYQNALHLFPLSDSQWSPKVLTCSSLKNEGITEVWQTVEEYIQHTRNNHYFIQKRSEQDKQWMIETIEQHLHQNFYEHPEVKKLLPILTENVLMKKCTPYQAAMQLLQIMTK